MLSTLGRRSLTVSRQAVRCVSVWSAVPAGPPDPILGMSGTLKEQVLLFSLPHFMFSCHDLEFLIY